MAASPARFAYVMLSETGSVRWCHCLDIGGSAATQNQPNDLEEVLKAGYTPLREVPLNTASAASGILLVLTKPATR